MPPYASATHEGPRCGRRCRQKAVRWGPPLNMTHVDGSHRLRGMMQGTEQGLEYTRFNKGLTGGTKEDRPRCGAQGT